MSGRSKAAAKDTDMGNVQELNQDGWPAWQQVRQSKRIKVAGVSHLKLDDQNQTKNKEMGMEGNFSLQQNSFAVLANSQIVSLANQMGIDSDSISFEKIDLLKDLENARMKLNEQSSVTVDKVVLDWGSEDSEEEPLILVNSVRKSRSSKKKAKRKTRVLRNPPFEDSVNSDGGKSKVSPRFNLRDRKTIKKVYK
jgi:type III secretory pathway component EscV